MIVPTADRSKATVLTKVKFLKKDNRVLPEMSAKVSFLSRPVGPGEKPKTAVPVSALLKMNGKFIVYRVEGTRVRAIEIQKGPGLLDFIEVTQGLKVGDRVVLQPNRNLRDGARVKIAEK
jgi:hypothetical protein